MKTIATCPKCESTHVTPVAPASMVMECDKCNKIWHLAGGEANEPQPMHNVKAAKPIPAELPPLHDDLVPVTADVLKEMQRQDAKWGAARNHTAPVWMTILMEEVGEASEDCNNIIFDDAESTKMEIELIQTAAVAIQAVASLRRERLKG